MAIYAENTSVSVEKSQAEIRKTVNRYSADQFVFGERDGQSMIGFSMSNRQVKFFILYDKKEEFKKDGAGRKRNQSQVLAAWEKSCRQKWRALALVIKAKLEAVESGITEFDEEFLAHIVLPNGQTFGSHAIPELQKAYKKGTMPALMPAMSER